MLGQTVIHYKIEERIGAGGMGEVYKARDLKLERPVVLKFPHMETTRIAEIRERLIREAKVCSALNHPNIVTVYEINEWNNRLFICMEYIEGKTLTKISRSRVIPIPEVLGIFAQIISAVNAAHKKGVLHRDLKSSNIMLTADGLVKVLDFGLAKFINATALTQGQGFMGTPAYAAPEIIQSQTPDHRSDIFALGVVFYELLAGRLPFPGDTPPALLYNIAYNPPVPLAEAGRPVPPELEAVILQALAKEPDKRYQQLEAMLNDLHKLQSPRFDAPAERSTLKIRAAAAPAIETLRTSPPLGRIDLDRLAQRLHLPKRDPGENPYLNRVMIREPQDFYGRKSEVQRIYARIASGSRPQSISVVGERRTGKSSLLHFLYHPDNRKKFLPKPETYVFALMDFQEERMTGLKDFFTAIFEAFAQELGDEFKAGFNPDYQGFRALVRTLDGRGIRMIVLFDEFEMVTSNKLFDPEFFAFFRSMANKYNIAYIATTAKDLQSLCHSKEIATSPFFNIFSNLNLGAFKAEEAVELIREPSAAAGCPLEPFADDILRFAGLFPFYLQMACAVFFELAKSGRKRDAATLQEAKRSFLEEAGVHFKNTWEKFSPVEQALVAGLLQGKKPRESEVYLANKLLKESYLIENNGQFTLFSETFAEHVRQNLGGASFWQKLKFW
jgi:serine/threonine protein kinase